MRVFRIKEWNEVTRLVKHTEDVTCTQWSHMAKELVTCSLDRTVKVFALPQDEE